MISPRVLNDYGNLLLTFTMLWAYLSFSQYLIIWAGNLQEEIPWYMVRARGGWAWVALAADHLPLRGAVPAAALAFCQAAGGDRWAGWRQACSS